MESLPDIFAKDISNLFALVSWATDTQLHGTYAQRHPNLGKTRRCPHCGIRRREFGPRCCNTAYTKTMKVRTPEGIIEKEVPERVTEARISKSFIKKLIHKSQNKRNGQRHGVCIRYQSLLFQRDQLLLETAAKEMHVKVPDPAVIPAFAEKYWLWKQERADRKIRRQQDRSRRINNGHCSKSN